MAFESLIFLDIYFNSYFNWFIFMVVGGIFFR